MHSRPTVLGHVGCPRFVALKKDPVTKRKNKKNKKKVRGYKRSSLLSLIKNLAFFFFFSWSTHASNLGGLHVLAPMENARFSIYFIFCFPCVRRSAEAATCAFHAGKSADGDTDVVANRNFIHDTRSWTCRSQRVDNAKQKIATREGVAA